MKIKPLNLNLTHEETIELIFQYLAIFNPNTFAILHHTLTQHPFRYIAYQECNNGQFELYAFELLSAAHQFLSSPDNFMIYDNNIRQWAICEYSEDPITRTLKQPALGLVLGKFKASIVTPKHKTGTATTDLITIPNYTYSTFKDILEIPHTPKEHDNAHILLSILINKKVKTLGLTPPSIKFKELLDIADKNHRQHLYSLTFQNTATALILFDKEHSNIFIDTKIFVLNPQQHQLCIELLLNTFNIDFHWYKNQKPTLVTNNIHDNAAPLLSLLIDKTNSFGRSGTFSEDNEPTHNTTT